MKLAPTAAFAATLALVAIDPALALVSRTFVSADGNDGNDCLQPSTPCRTLGAAIAKVDADGVVLVISSGSYAGATVNKSVRVLVAPGVVAFSSFPITVNASNVVLRGIIMKALVTGAGTAIDLQAGTLTLENSQIDGYFHAMSVAPGATAVLAGSAIRNNLTGIDCLGRCLVVDSVFESNGEGIYARDLGVENMELTVRDSKFLNNSAGVRLRGLNPGIASTLWLDRNLFAGNGAGLHREGAYQSAYSFGNNSFSANFSDVIGGDPSIVASK